MYFNFHDHYSFYKDKETSLSILEKEKIHTLFVSMNLEEYLSLKETFSDHPLISIGLGIHPWEVKKENNLKSLKPYFSSCDFIGEIGMDFYWAEQKEYYPQQKEVFEFFLQKAEEYQKFPNIHTKGAELEILSLLQKYNVPTPVIHWYSGPLELVEKYLEEGCYFTIGPDVGYSKITSELLQILPLDRILSETDGATSVEWVNGIYGEPDYIKMIVESIAKEKHLPLEQVREQLYQNGQNILSK